MESRQIELLEKVMKLKIGSNPIEQAFVKLVREKLDKIGWDGTFEYASKHRHFERGPIGHLYNGLYSIMWSINRRK